jgi:hypothetical protein
MNRITVVFAEQFAHWGLTLPAADVAARRRGEIAAKGWSVQYRFGQDERGEYLDYYAAHRMTDDSHVRIRESGECEYLPAIGSMYLSSPDPVEAERRRAEHVQANRKVADLLAQKGFGLSLNGCMRAGEPELEGGDEDEDGADSEAAVRALACFRMPTPMKIMARTSSVTNAFVNGIIPVVPPSAVEVAEALEVLGLSADDLRCAYCGDRASEWDHFRPIVTGRRPTGYISELANLVPACGKCNQSKGASPWRTWITGPAKLSPASRGVADLDERIARLEAFERWRTPTVVDFEAAVGAELWARYWAEHDRLLGVMRECQTTADEVALAIQEYVRKVASP